MMRFEQARARAILAVDRLRCPLPFLAPAHGHNKEWLHFCVLGRREPLEAFLGLG
jgi:hypothetical protein